MMQHCRNCTYFMRGNLSICNAFHAPTDNAINCTDWKASQLALDVIAASKAWFENGGADKVRAGIQAVITQQG